MHLELFLSGNGTVEQLKTVASIINLGSVLAWQRHDAVRQQSLHEALEVVADCATRRVGNDVPAPTPAAAEQLRSTIVMLDRWLGIQNMHTLQKASAYVNAAISNKAAADVKAVFGTE